MATTEDEKLTKLAVNNFLIKNKHAAIKGKKFVIDRLVHNVKKLQQRVSKVGEGGGDAVAFQRKEKRMTEEIQILKTLRPENILKFGILNKKTFQKVSSTPDSNIKEVALCRLVENPSIKKVIEEFRGNYPNYEEKVRVMFQTMGLQKIKHRKQRMSKLKRMGTLDQYLAKEQQNVEILEELLGIDVNSGILKRRTSSAFKAFQEERGSGRKIEEEGGPGGKTAEEKSSGDNFFITSIFKNAEEDESEALGSDGYESGSDGGDDDDDMDDEYNDGESDDEGSEFESEENEKEVKPTSAIENKRTINKVEGDNLNSKAKNINNGKKTDSLNNNKTIENSSNKIGNDTEKSVDTPQKRKLSQTPEVLESNSSLKKQKLDKNNHGAPQPNATPKETKPSSNKVKTPQAKQKDGKGDKKNEAKKKNTKKKKQLQKAAPTEEVRVLKLSEAGEGTINPLKAQKIDSDSEAEEDFFIRDPSKKTKEEESDEEEQEEDFIDIDTSIYFRRNLYRGSGVEEADDGLISGRGRGSRARGGRGRGSFPENPRTRDDNFSRQRGRGREDGRGRGRGDARGGGRGGRGDDRGRGRGGGGDDRGRGRGGRGDNRGRGRGGGGDDRGRGRGRGDGPKGPGDGPLHPSWEAKIKQNTHNISKFQGKKIVFD